MAMMNSVNISEFNQQLIADALQGRWSKRWDAVLRLTIMKTHAFLSSPIVKETTEISMTLPAHQSFYLMIASSSGVRTVLVDTDAPIKTTLQAGESASAVFTLSK